MFCLKRDLMSKEKSGVKKSLTTDKLLKAISNYVSLFVWWSLRVKKLKNAHFFRSSRRRRKILAIFLLSTQRFVL